MPDGQVLMRMPSRKIIFWLLAAFVTYFIAWNVGSGWLYLLASIILAVPLLSFIMARLDTRSLDVSLAAPAEAVQGDDLAAALTISNRSFLPRYLIRLEVDLAGGTSRILVPAINGHGSEQIWIDLPGVRRGVFPGAAVRLSSSAPFGIFSGRRDQTVDSPLAVFPRSYAIGTDWESGRSSSGYLQASSMPTRKSSGDYLGVRGYRPEDSPRSIHWRTTARTGQLAVVEYARQVALNPVIIVDDWREADFGGASASSFETAIRIAASLVSRESLQNRRFALGSSPADAADRGMSHKADAAFLWLAGIEAAGDRPLDLGPAPLPWPDATPVVIMASHISYAGLAGSGLLATYPQTVVIMLDWRDLEPDRRRSSSMLGDEPLEEMADLIERRGGRFLLIDTPEQVERCLQDL